MLSKGHECECLLCDLDKVEEALRAAERARDEALAIVESWRVEAQIVRRDSYSAGYRAGKKLASSAAETP
jgi:hypothetical protein